MTFLDPNTLFDVGFQLSFMATLGLMVYARPLADSTRAILARLFSGNLARRIVDIINDVLLVTLAAQVMTLPLLMVYFRQISLVSLIVNPLVLPTSYLKSRPRENRDSPARDFAISILTTGVHCRYPGDVQ